ncbi:MULTISPECIES: SDR family NAD(P)-dependent oxidoreductase [Pseudomonas]|uniref:SDR family NAD(P)-dependent oxidoreductase n=1 Tax=Pseudomonas TaxID=286 RepID=UPI001BECD3D7|nr:MULTISPECIES: SDR family NAD(P)-dependent oxidoreductase [Pseudomonas]MBT2341639.1 SDR family NAD(P)-dependent oxidoreductase [Pseudomonas fluorescens]MCD4531108.1 SDR family NAD(P)-dependent oxidoreductase [Pseudomonas sp. C3-2018]
MANLYQTIGRRRVLAYATTLCTAALGVSMMPKTLLAAAIGSENRTERKRVLITGSTAGLGQMAARLLVEQGHEVVLHGRSLASAQKALEEIPGAGGALHGDFQSLEQIKDVARQANATGLFDSIIHNAAIGDSESKRVVTDDGLPRLFSINVLAPYMLTALIQKPKRLVYMTSSMQQSADGESALGDILWEKRSWSGSAAYSESKMLVSMMAFAVAKSWASVRSNTVDPGWVPTRMGGSSAFDDLNQGHLTQAWLAVSDESSALVTGQNFYHMNRKISNPDAGDASLQSRLIALCAQLSNTPFIE